MSGLILFILSVYFLLGYIFAESVLGDDRDRVVRREPSFYAALICFWPFWTVLLIGLMTWQRFQRRR